MMKFSRRIRDLLRANLASPPRFSDLRKARSPAQMERQLERIRKSLARAALREKQLQDDLALAEEEGRERDAIRLRRELAELGRSTDELQATLDLIEAHIEMAGQRGTPEAEAAEASPAAGQQLASDLQTSLAAPEEGEEADLEARKARLAAPADRRGKKTER
jgi:hypothetical protein